MTGIVIIAALFLLTLMVGALSWEKSRKGRLRRTDLAVTILSVLLGGAWLVALQPETSAAAPAAATEESRAATATCASIIPGDRADSVRVRLGEPDERRSEAETRGPAAEVWIYRRSRCAIHLLGSAVESIE